MAFWWLDHRVKWTGLGASCPQVVALSTNHHLPLLLAEFVDVFAEPIGLPPPQPFDHRIHLLSSMLSIAVRLFRYPQLLSY
jgi:hypothetical protein